MEDKTTRAYSRQHQRNLDNERVKVTTTNTTNVKPTPAPKAPLSAFVILTFAVLIVGLIFLIVGTVFALPYLVAFAGFDALMAVTFAVLSLRERV